MHIIAGDFNARIIDNFGIEDRVGEFLFNQGLDDRLSLPPQQLENRERLLKWIYDNAYNIRSTYFEQDRWDLISFRHDASKKQFPQSNKHTDQGYGQLDYLLINDKWKNNKAQ